jgi:type VI secretion system secreted protein Hcp
MITSAEWIRQGGNEMRMNARNLTMAAALVLVVAVGIPLQAAETVHLSLKINGVDVKGTSTQTSLGRGDTIECTYYEQSISSAAQEAVRDPLDGRQMTRGGPPRYNPIRIRKRIDKSSPLLIKAISDGQTVDGTFKFYRPNPTGDGTTEQFYTVRFEGGRVESIKQYVPDTIVPAISTDPPLEEVTFTYSTITFSFSNAASTTTKPVRASSAQ